jgi:muramoyltetrapeptide carboxypeptidase
MVASLVGTPWLPSVPGGILFLEDVGEHPYRIERMLTQLLYAGILGQQQAVLLGQFSQFKPVPHDRGFNLKSVSTWLRAQLAAPTSWCPAGVPVLTDLPFGHVPTKVLLPVGKPVELHLMGAEALMFWD